MTNLGSTVVDVRVNDLNNVAVDVLAMNLDTVVVVDVLVCDWDSKVVMVVVQQFVDSLDVVEVVDEVVEMVSIVADHELPEHCLMLQSFDSSKQYL